MKKSNNNNNNNNNNNKETITILPNGILNAISDHEMSFEIKHTIKHNFRFKLAKS